MRVLPQKSPTLCPYICHKITLLCTIETLNKGKSIGACTGTCVSPMKVPQCKSCSRLMPRQSRFLSQPIPQ
jgi:hypothetical protein